MGPVSGYDSKYLEVPDGYYDYDEKSSFPEHLRRRRAFEALVRQQTNDAERQFLDDVDLQIIISRTQALRSKIGSTDIFSHFNHHNDFYEDEEDSVTNGLTTFEGANLMPMRKSEEDIKSVDIEWVMEFDSREDLLECQEKYFQVVDKLSTGHKSLLSRTSRMLLQMEEGTRNRKSIQHNRKNKVSTAEDLRTGILGCWPSLEHLQTIKTFNTWHLPIAVIFFVAVMTMVAVTFCILQDTNRSEVIERVMWPWTVLIRYPLLKHLFFGPFAYLKERLEDDEYFY